MNSRLASSSARGGGGPGSHHLPLQQSDHLVQGHPSLADRMLQETGALACRTPPMQTVVVHYKGLLWHTGERFATSWRGPHGPVPLAFHLGSAQIIRGVLER